MREMHALDAAFEVIPFPKAQQKECLAFYTEEDVLILVIADPLNDALLEWSAENIKQTFTWRLAHRTDVAAFLARHEETMHAMDGLSSGEQNQYTDTDTAIVHLSLKSINEDTNLIVKLINSTLYDGLKAGASDIYLECANTGLAIKYRIDGVNDCSTQTNT